jgi:hypothetical protein
MSYAHYTSIESTPLRIDEQLSQTAPSVRSYLSKYLKSPRFNLFILSLVLVDLAFSVIEIVIAALEDEELEHHVLLRVINVLSFGILGVFVTELLLNVYVFGIKHFSSWFNVLDAILIIGAIVIEVILSGTERDVASLVVVFRLWRVVKVMDGVATTMKLRYEKKLDELEHQVEMLEAELQAERRERAALEARLQMYAAV